MALRPKRGFTLVELIVYFMLSALVIGLMVSMFTVAKRTQQHTSAQYLVGGPIASTIRLLRRELQATALTSIQVYPGNTGTERPGMSCVSAYDTDGKFTLGDYGTPKWQKHVFYTLNEKGALERWSQEFTDKNFLPQLATTMPSARVDGGKSLLHGLLLPNKEVKDVQAATPFGGFEVAFVRRTNGVDSLDYTNPAKSKDYANHTRLVEVILRTQADRNPTFSEVRFRVCPRY